MTVQAGISSAGSSFFSSFFFSSSLVKLVEIKRRKEARLLNPRRRKNPRRKRKRRKRNLLMISQLSLRKKDPFESMPKGTFDLEEWKRFYSNNDEDESIKWFWEHFDHENYSIWRGDYKYNDELTMVFMSCNLIGGMFQRLEKLKK